MKNPNGMIIIYKCPVGKAETEHYLTAEEIVADIKITPKKVWVELKGCVICNGNHRIAIATKEK